MERQSGQSLQLALRAGKIGTWEIEFPSRILVASAQCKANFGRSPEKAFSYEDLLASICDEDRPTQQKTIESAAASGGEFALEYRCIWPDGSIHWIGVSGVAIRGSDGQSSSMSGITQEITGRKRAEEQRTGAAAQMLKAVEGFRTLADAMPQMVWTARPDGFVDYYNQQWLDYTGLTLEETQGWGWKRTQHPQDVQSAVDNWEISVATGQVFESEIRFLRAADQSWRWHFTRAIPVRDETGKIAQWIGTCTDIDDRKAAEDTLRKARELVEAGVREQLEARVSERTADLSREINERKKAESEMRTLSRQLLTLRDEEQRRMARDLHDSVGQLLAATTMSLAVAARGADRMNREAAKALSDATALVNDTINEVRVVSHLLHPQLLDEAGLPSAVKCYLEGYEQRAKVTAEFIVSDGFGRLPTELETAIFRVIQESLTNIHRHSGSKTAKISVFRLPNEIQVEVQDHGKGMPARQSSGVGLRGMRERLGKFGGELDVVSGPDGTTIRARLPVQ